MTITLDCACPIGRSVEAPRYVAMLSRLDGLADPTARDVVRRSVPSASSCRWIW